MDILCIVHVCQSTVRYHQCKVTTVRYLNVVSRLNINTTGWTQLGINRSILPSFVSNCNMTTVRINTIEFTKVRYQQKYRQKFCINSVKWPQLGIDCRTLLKPHIITIKAPYTTVRVSYMH